MKKYFVFISIILISQKLIAQQTYFEDGRITIFGHSLENSPSGIIQDKQGIEIKKNAIKFNLTPLANKAFEVQYERAITTKLSVAISASYRPNSTFAGTKQISDFLNDSLNFINNVTTGYSMVIPELRFYFRQSMKGMYLAPYFRIKSSQFNFPVSYIDNSSQKQSFVVKGKFASSGGGLMLGSHFLIGKNFSLDWYLGGVHYFNSSIDIKSNSSTITLSPSDQLQVQNNIESYKDVIKFFIQDFKYAVSSNEVQLTGKMQGIGIRSGLCIGYRF